MRAIKAAAVAATLVVAATACGDDAFISNQEGIFDSQENGEIVTVNADGYELTCVVVAKDGYHESYTMSDCLWPQEANR